ncbi:MAG: KamA family radical SAM protein [Deltaproteobacteria bacterium]|nr:KamA family radical SAM protein [Deltaproteobacteria bacterium]
MPETRALDNDSRGSENHSNCEEWKAQLQHCVTSLEALESALVLTDSERDGVRESLARGFPMSITPYYLSLCDRNDARCPIRRQCVPSREESLRIPGDMRDPLGEQSHQKAPFLIQRYPDRVLLLVSDACSVYCRFCTRSRLVGRGRGAVSIARLKDAFHYISRNTQIREVIVSGGDPMLMPTEHLAMIIKRLASIQTISNIRIATRVLATLPQRITRDLCEAVSLYQACWVMTHFNHPKELTEQSRRAIAMLADRGIPMMNQTVLLRGINDDAATLQALFRGLVSVRIRPYYLHQTDPVDGSGHFRTPIKIGIDIMKQLQGNLSGIALPKLMVDTPGGKGKVPIGPNYIEGRRGLNSSTTTTLRTFQGECVEYIDPPHADFNEARRLDQARAFTPPKALRPGDTIAVVAPAGPFDLDKFERGVARLAERYRVSYDPRIADRKGYLAGDDERRIQELLKALENEEIKAIVTARGGYGATRLLPLIDPSIIKKHPKPLIGFSDITALHASWARARVRSIHGSNLVGLADLDQRLFERWISIAEGEIPEAISGLEKIAPGSGSGPLIGGNLSVISALVGTPFGPPLSGSVLFLEEVKEAPYRIDRMLTSLYQAGWLQQLSAVVLGAFEQAEIGPSQVTAEETLRDRLGGLEIPVLSGIPSGHIPDNAELPLGAMVSVDTEKGVLVFNQPASEK